MQGGCAALEDGIVLAQCLKPVWQSESPTDLEAALATYEKQRAARCTPLTARARGMGAVLQSPLPPVVAARDFAISRLLDPSSFFDHTLFDVGEL